MDNFIQNPQTIAQALSHGAERLTFAGVLSAGLDARILLGFVLGKSIEALIAAPDKALSQAQWQAFDGLLSRREQREPLSHLTGLREFWKDSFEVGSHVLDPRPDSETVIESVLKHMPDTSQPLRILDLGTGSGCLLLSLLREYGQATGVGVDVSPPAKEQAERNAVRLGLAKRAVFLLSYWSEELGGQFDLIVSNPPYIPSQAIDALMPEVAGYEPRLGLDGGEDGLMAYRLIIPELDSLLLPDGMVVFETGEGQTRDVAALLEEYKFSVIAFEKDLSTTERCVIAKKTNQ